MTENNNLEKSTPPASLVGRLVRRPLEVENVYHFQGYKNNGFKIKAIALPDKPGYDGGLPGVSIKWLNKAGGSGWWPCNSEAEFWEIPVFRNACDPECA